MIMHVRLPLVCQPYVFLLAMLFIHADIRAENTDVVFSIKGAPALSMASYGLVTKEIGPIRTDTLERQKYTNAIRKGRVEFFGPIAPLAPDVLKTFLQYSTFTLKDYQNRVAGIKDAKVGNERLTIFGTVGGAALSAALGLSSLSVNEILDQQMEKFEKERSKQMEELLSWALAKDKKFKQHIQERMEADPTFRSVIKEMVEKDPTVKQFVNGLKRESSRQSAKAGMASVLPSAMSKAQNMSVGNATEMEERSKQNVEKLTGLENGLDQYRNTLQRDMSSMQDTLEKQGQALDAIRKDLAEQGKTAAQTAEDVKLLQDLLWGHLTAEEKLYAFDHGLAKRLPPEKRQETRAHLENLANAERFSSNVDVGLTYVRGIGNLVRLIGGNVDMQQLETNIAGAQQAANVVTQLIAQNYVGAIIGLGGLFGSSTSPEAEHHKQIMESLEKIHTLQLKTLQAIIELSNQVSHATQIIMSQLVNLEYKQDLTNYVLADANDRTPQNACLEFTDRAVGDYGMDTNGRFPSYDARREHFSSRFTQFARCFSYLDEAVHQLNNMDARPHHALWVSSLNPANPKLWQGTHWAPMLAFTHQMLGTAGNRHCSSRLVGLALQTPLHFGDVNHGSLSCPNGNDIPETSDGIYKSFNGRIVDGTAVEQFLYLPAVQRIGDFLAFYAPYDELRKADNTLFTIKELMEKTVNSKPSTGELWMAKYLDVTNVALAQETIYSGVFLVKDVTDKILTKRKFGDAPADEKKSSFFDAWRTCWQRLEKGVSFQSEPKINCGNLTTEEATPTIKKATQETMRAEIHANLSQQGLEESDGSLCKNMSAEGMDQYFALSCLMESNPVFAKNIVAYLVLRALEQSSKLNAKDGQYTNGTEVVYRVAYSYKDPLWISKVLPELPLEWRQEEGGTEGWNLVLRHHTGERWYLPLPPPATVARGSVEYLPTMPVASRYRDQLLQRYLFHSVHRRVMLDTKSPKPLKDKTAKLMQGIALYTGDSVFAETLPRPSVPGPRSSMSASN